MRGRMVVKNVVWTPEFTMLLLLTVSYFYCLPLLRTGVVFGITASEIRVYDIIFLLMLFRFIFPRLGKIIQAWSTYSQAHRYLLVWLGMAFIGLLVTLFYNENRFIVGAIRYFRFVSFSFVFILGFYYIKNRQQLLFLYDTLLLAVIAIAFVGTLQGFKILPNFWPDYYSIYWQNEEGFLATASLAPNHTHYSLIMSIGMIMVFARNKIRPNDRMLNLFYLVGTVFMFYSMLTSKGRSGWLLLGVYLAYILLFDRSGRILIVGVVCIFGWLIYNNLDVQAGNTTVRDILLYRSVTTVKQANRTVFDAFEEGDKNIIQRVDDSRWSIYTRSVGFLFENPQYLMVGAGFQNASQGIGHVAVAAHNAYINVVAEHGVLGLIVYLTSLYWMYKFGAATRRKANSKESYTMATHWIGMFAGLLVTNFFGEILYPGRALFTFLGTFFTVTVLLLHPAWRAQPKPQLEPLDAAKRA